MPYDELKPFKVYRLGRRHASGEGDLRRPARAARPIYWIGGAGARAKDGEGTDFHATAQGHVSITPLQVDLTDHASAGALARAAPRRRAA